MGSNPMQKMKRNSILTGLIIGLMIGLVLCVFVYLFFSKNGGISAGGTTVSVCVLNKTIKSGTQVTAADIVTKKVNSEDAPKDATTQVINGIAKIDLTEGTILTSGMLNTSSSNITDDLREQEYNMITLPSQLSVGDFVDIRLQMPNGADYIIISKKKVIKCNATNLWLNMNEEEIELMSNAIIEYYIMTGSKLYATIYTDPGIQAASTGTYVPSQTVSALIAANPNIKTYVNSERYSDALKDIRNKYINEALAPYYKDSNGDGKTDALENIETNMEEEIKTLQESREAYFGTLNAAN